MENRRTNDRRMSLSSGNTTGRVEWREIRVVSGIGHGGRWNVAKGKLKQIYGELTADETAFMEGSEDELVGRLQKELDRPEGEVRHLLKEARENQTL